MAAKSSDKKYRSPLKKKPLEEEKHDISQEHTEAYKLKMFESYGERYHKQSIRLNFDFQSNGFDSGCKLFEKKKEEKFKFNAKTCTPPTNADDEKNETRQEFSTLTFFHVFARVRTASPAIAIRIAIS